MPRSYYYKAYKVICKMLGCTALCYGKLSKSFGVKREVIYAVTPLGKTPLVAYADPDKQLGLSQPTGSCISSFLSCLSLSSKARRKPDVQLEVTKTVIRVVAKHSVGIWGRGLAETPCIPAGTSFEPLVIEHDMDMDLEAE